MVDSPPPVFLLKKVFPPPSLQNFLLRKALKCTSNSTYDRLNNIVLNTTLVARRNRFRSVVVITFALHAKGLRFEPGRNQF